MNLAIWLPAMFVLGLACNGLVLRVLASVRQNLKVTYGDLLERCGGNADVRVPYRRHDPARLVLAARFRSRRQRLKIDVVSSCIVNSLHHDFSHSNKPIYDLDHGW